MKRLWKFLVSFAVGLMVLSTGFSSWAFNVEAKADNTVQYSAVTGRIDNYLNNSSTPYASFTTLEDAVSSANSNATGSNKVSMYLSTGSHIVVKNQHLTLNSGVSLFMPYEDKTYTISSDSDIGSMSDGFIDTSSSNISKYMVGSFSFVNSTIDVASGATLYLGAKYREKGVSGSYTQISLDSSSSISVHGSMYCNGYVKETNSVNVDQSTNENDGLFYNSIDSSRLINVYSGGYFHTPLAFYDAGGMSELTGLNSRSIFPINVFDFPNVQTYLKIDAGATFEANARMKRATGSNTFNINETVRIVKPSSSSGDSLFTLTSGYISFEYCPLNPGFTSSDASKTFMVFNGSTSIGSLTITVNSVDISTKNKFMPMSYKMRMVIGSSGHLNTGSAKVKFMGGSKLRIMPGGQLTNSSEIIVYKATSTEGIIDYPTTYGDGIMTVDGTFTVANSAKFGGHISTTTVDDSAVLDFENTTSSSLKSSSVEGMSETTISQTATGDFYDSSAGEVSTSLLSSGRIIHSDSSGHRCWESSASIASYTLSIVINNSNNYAYPLAGYMVYKVTSSSDVLLSTEGIYMTTGSSYQLEVGDRFKVVSLDRSENTSFTSQTGSSYTFTSGNTYEIKGNTEITIVPGEGVLVRFSFDGESGAGGATAEYYESLTSNGTYYQIGQYGGSGNAAEIAVKKNAYVKYNFKLGQCNGTVPEDHYLFNGIVKSVTEDSKTSGTKLTTTVNDVGSIASATSGGSTSVSTNTLISGNSTIHAYIKARDSGGSCLTPDTRVLMANGQYRPVGSLDAGDEVLVFNHETGTVDVAPILFNEHDPAVWHNVINLEFSNGETIKVVGEHGYFDKTTMKYEYINEDTFESYVGDYFHSLNGDVLLERAYITREYTDVCEPATRYHINFFTESMLSMPGGIEGLFNIFEYDQTLKYNEELKNRDIELYGLFTYADFADLVTEQLFNCYPTPYFKVAIGKGILTEERLMYYIERYGWYNS